jgi:hypothetical protein
MAESERKQSIRKFLEGTSEGRTPVQRFFAETPYSPFTSRSSGDVISGAADEIVDAAKFLANVPVKSFNYYTGKTADPERPPTAIDIRPKNFEARTVPQAQPLMGPNNVVASSIDPNTGREFPAGQELDADNIAISQLRSIAKEPGAAAANEAKAAGILGVDFGAKTAQSQNQKNLLDSASESISGLLGDVDWRGILRVLARPEFVKPMGPGQSPVTNFIEAAAADRTAQATARAAQQAAGLEGFKAETDRLKALMPDYSKMPKLTAEVNKMYDRIESSRRISEIGSKIKAALTANPFSTTGGPGETAKAIRSIAAAFGISPDTFDTDDVQKNIAKLKAEVLKSKTFGREASRQELEQILNRILAEPGLFTTSTQLLDSVDSMMRDAERNIYNTTARMKAFGIFTSTDTNPMSMPERYFKRNNQKAN